MIFFCDSNGNQLFRTPTEIYQGSNRANVIYFVCPIASTNIVSVAFKLPNGEYLPKKTMQLANDLPIDGKDFENFNVWTYAIPYPVSQYAGTVTVQFFITTVENTIATSSFTFTVQKGIPNIKENEDYDEDDLSNIMFLIANLGNEISDKLGKGETANSSKTIEGFKRVDFESENEDLTTGWFRWLPSEIKTEINEETARVIFGFQVQGLGTLGYGSMAFVERKQGRLDGITDTKIDLLIDGDVYFNNAQDNMVSILSTLNDKLGKTETANSSKTLEGLVRLDYEGNEDKFTWLPQVIQDEITAGTSKVIFGLDRHDDKVVGALPSDGRGSMVFVERTFEVERNGKTVTDTKIELLIDGDIYVYDGEKSISLLGALDGKQEALVSGENIKTINGQSLLGSGDIQVQGGSGSNITVDGVLSTTSENAVQNKVVTEALNGKLNKITPPISVNPTSYAYIAKIAGKADGSTVSQESIEVAASAKGSTIALRGGTGAIYVAEPAVGTHAVNRDYFDKNIGHRYKFTAEASAHVAGAEGTTITFYHDTKSQFDLEILAQELEGKDIMVLGHILPISQVDITESPVLGVMSSSLIAVENNVLTVTVDDGNGIYLYNSGISTYQTRLAGTFTFSVEQIY